MVSTDEDGNLPGIDLSSNDGALALSEPAFLSDPISFSSEASDSLFENPEDTDLFLSDNFDLLNDQSFEIADCSSSDFSPSVNGKSRVKRIEGGTRCQNPDSPLDASNPLLHEPFDVIKHLEDSLAKATSRKELNYNGICAAITRNVLPWGACSNSVNYWASPIEPISPLLREPRIVGMQLYNLRYCTICKI